GYFRGGAATGASYADFDQAYDPYTSYAQGAGGGSYTARSGDSLASVAAQLWGDASLWYKLAQANGMGADGALTAGQVLNVPGGVSKSGNNAGTSKPYNSADAYGDTSPTTPAPQEGSSLRSTCLLEATANRRRAAREDRA
ncbi:LysM peptidoglycan-binding domain-containing protein, partial [Sphingomonas sp.]|uniref:LysM peptidoglycan-binding domain-containing protein n=1 Tax=Sphingomonas sp. TaxID=28214 RepID=UPI002E305B62